MSEGQTDHSPKSLPISRRNFLKGAAAIIGAAIIDKNRIGHSLAKNSEQTPKIEVSLLDKEYLTSDPTIDTILLDMNNSINNPDFCLEGYEPISHLVDYLKTKPTIDFKMTISLTDPIDQSGKKKEINRTVIINKAGATYTSLLGRDKTPEEIAKEKDEGQLSDEDIALPVYDTKQNYTTTSDKLTTKDYLTKLQNKKELMTLITIEFSSPVVQLELDPKDKNREYLEELYKTLAKEQGEQVESPGVTYDLRPINLDMISLDFSRRYSFTPANPNEKAKPQVSAVLSTQLEVNNRAVFNSINIQTIYLDNSQRSVKTSKKKAAVNFPIKEDSQKTGLQPLSQDKTKALDEVLSLLINH